MIIVPKAFARDTIAREGEAGREWIEALPGLVETLCEKWSLVVDGASLHGYLGMVVPVRRGEDLYALKVSWPGISVREDATALSAWDGRGAVRLLDVDLEHSAMLLERLDYTRSLNDVGIEDAVRIAGRLLRRLAIAQRAPAPEGHNLPLLSTWATEVSRSLPERWKQYGRPMPRTLLDRAVELTAQLGRACTSNLLVNYDLHYADVLAGRREPWLAVDPRVVVGEPEFGMAQLLWRRMEEMEAHSGLPHYFHVLTEAAELDPALARSWTLVRCIDYWLWGLSVGLTYDPARCEFIISKLALSKAI